jgi:transposase
MTVEDKQDFAMAAPMSMDLRLRIVGAIERGSSIRQAVRRFAVSPSVAIKLMQRVRADRERRAGALWRAPAARARADGAAAALRGAGWSLDDPQRASADRSAAQKSP